MSLLGALTPLGKVANGKRRWLAGVVAYTLAGLLTSTLVGVSLGAVGRWLIGNDTRASGVSVVFVISIVAALRGLGCLRLVLPRVRRQTRESWGKRLHPTVSATLWGLDLGLALSTRFTFTGLSMLVGVAIVMGDPVLGALLFASLWLARALPSWLAPRLVKPQDTTLDFVAAVDLQRGMLRSTNTIGVLFAAGLLLVWLFRSSIVQLAVSPNDVLSYFA